MKIESLKILKKLDFTKQLVFAYLTCERLYVNYEYFSENFNFGNPAVLRNGIDCLYENLFEKNASNSEIGRLIDQAERNAPEINNTIAYSAAGACLALYHSLCFLMDKHLLHIAYISTVATDLVDKFIAEIENPDLDNAFDVNTDFDLRKKRNEHRLMVKEIARQSAIIGYLNKNNNLSYEDVKMLLSMQRRVRKKR